MSVLRGDDQINGSAWHLVPGTAVCPFWSRERAAKLTESTVLTVNNSDKPDIKTEIPITCHYEACLNRKAIELGEEIVSDGESVTLDPVTYKVHTEAISVELPVADAWCYHKRT